jgi:GrpB-like predicted nucleotidyltransferase (UPF0157 family)
MTEDLNRMTAEELGRLFPILIVDHNPDWGRLYLLEKQNIQTAIGIKNIHKIEHIGSTAVPGLCAKPTIDILLEITDDTNIDLLINNLQRIEYQYISKPDNPPPHIMFAKGYSNNGLTGQTCHVHIRYSGDWDEIVFRDYLIENPDVAQQYGDLKRSLSIKYKNDREKYTDSKTDFIKRMIAIAKENK